MEYVRLANGLTSYKLIPTDEDIWNHITTNSKDYYVSLYRYTDAHFAQWKATNSVAGIKDVYTNKLYFDFDDKSDIDNARKDALTVITRLLDKGVPQDGIEITFSGRKGFGLSVDTRHKFNPDEFKQITAALAGDLKTFDTTVSDPNRIIRVTGTKHQDSHLYKFPLTLTQLSELPIDTIKELAKDLDNVDESAMSTTAHIELPKILMETKVLKEKQKEKPPITLEIDQEIDFSLKPKWLTKAKYALQLGHFPRGAGISHNAYMVLAATYKNQGFPKEVAYRMLKGVSERQAEIYSCERFCKVELWNKVIGSVYSPLWKGGQYTGENSPAIKWVTDNLGIKEESGDKGLIPITDVTDIFANFAENIDKNTMKLGIDVIDKEVRITTSMLVGLLAAPSAGKCLGKDTPVRMHDGSVKLVQDIVVGDLLMGDDSSPRTVRSVCRGSENLYKIDQASGMSYIINESHILSLKSNFEKSQGSKISKRIVDIPLTQYLKESGEFKKYFRGYHVGVEYTRQAVPIDPYFLGLWLGDGCNDSQDISKPDIEIKNYLKSVADSFGYKLSNRNKNNQKKCPTWSIVNSKGHPNALLNKLRETGVIKNKHIPEKFLINDRHTRLALLAGLLDSDGYYDKGRNIYEITVLQDALARDISQLVRSLGFRCTLNKTIKSCPTTNGIFTGVYNRMYISGELLGDIPCIVERKKAVNKKKNTDSTLTAIRVTPLGVGDYYGFEIDGNRRFLLEDYTVTHNTSIALDILNNASKNQTQAVFFSLDMGAPLVFQRLIQKHTGAKSAEIFKAFQNKTKDVERFSKAVEDNYQNVKFCFKSGISVEDMKEFVEDLDKRTGERTRLVVVDYLECITGPYSDPTANTSFIAQKLKDLANDLEVTVLLLLQPQKHAGDPSMELTSYRKIKGSSAIEQAASVVLTMWRPGFSPKNPQEDIYLTIAAVKNRMGSLNTFDFKWDGLRGSVEELDEYEKQELEALRDRRAREQASDSF